MTDEEAIKTGGYWAMVRAIESVWGFRATPAADFPTTQSLLDALATVIEREWLS